MLMDCRDGVGTATDFRDQIDRQMRANLATTLPGLEQCYAKAAGSDANAKSFEARVYRRFDSVLRGVSQGPEVYFAGRETVNKYYLAAPAIVQKYMDKFAKVVGRQYHLFD